MKFVSTAGALAALVSRLLVVPRQPGWLGVSQVEICIDGLAPAFDGYRIVQFSDLHFDGMMTTRARLDEMVARINAQQPDLIAFTGDFVTYPLAFQADDLIASLSRLEARDAKVAIAGNHDRYVIESVLADIIDSSGMINLNNAVHTIQRGGDCLHIAGVDSLLRHYARLDYVLPQLPDTGTAILLAHAPEFADVSASTGRFALQLSGHTHGGQIRIPLLTRLLIGGYFQRPLSGVMSVGGMAVYVTRGIGTVGLPVRVNCRPELSVITLRVAPPEEETLQD